MYVPRNWVQIKKSVLHKGLLMQDWVFRLGWWSYLDPQNDCFKKLPCTGLLIDLGKVILFGHIGLEVNLSGYPTKCI